MLKSKDTKEMNVEIKYVEIEHIDHDDKPIWWPWRGRMIVVLLILMCGFQYFWIHERNARAEEREQKRVELVAQRDTYSTQNMNEGGLVVSSPYNFVYVCKQTANLGLVFMRQDSNIFDKNDQQQFDDDKRMRYVCGEVPTQ